MNDNFESSILGHQAAQALIDHYKQGTLKANQINFESIAGIKKPQQMPSGGDTWANYMNSSLRGTMANFNKSPRPIH